jgi:putative ABC transport system permease protein
VIGILKKTGGSFGISLDDSIAIPMRDAQSLYNIGAQYTYLMAQADDITQVTQIAKDIKVRLGTGYMAVSYDTAKSSVEAVTGSISAVLGGIAAISLIVAGVGIINTMTVSVLERTREIGVLKAIGSKSRDILLMFITEAALTGIFGGALGATLGFGLGQIVGGMVGVPPSISLDTGVMVIGFAIIVSVLSGMYPAWRAANLNPVEALRSE